MGTYYLELPTRLEDITIASGTASDCQYVRAKCSEEDAPHVAPTNVFVLQTQERKYYIGAYKFELLTNTYDPGETSIGLKRRWPS